MTFHFLFCSIDEPDNIEAFASHANSVTEAANDAVLEFEARGYDRNSRYIDYEAQVESGEFEDLSSLGEEHSITALLL